MEVGLTALKAEQQQPIMNQAAMVVGFTALKAEQQQTIMNQAAKEVSLTALKAEQQQPVMNPAAMEVGLTALKTEQQHKPFKPLLVGGSCLEESIFRFLLFLVFFVNGYFGDLIWLLRSWCQTPIM